MTKADLYYIINIEVRKGKDMRERLAYAFRDPYSVISLAFILIFICTIGTCVGMYMMGKTALDILMLVLVVMIVLTIFLLFALYINEEV